MYKVVTEDGVIFCDEITYLNYDNDKVEMAAKEYYNCFNANGNIYAVGDGMPFPKASIAKISLSEVLRPVLENPDILTYISEVAHEMLKNYAPSNPNDVKGIYPAWETLMDSGRAVAVGTITVYIDHLFKCIQEHTPQLDWNPISAPSLWEEIPEEGKGTYDNPMEYNNNMTLENGKYYIQYGVIYRCWRDTGTPVYNDLKDLVGLYVEVASSRS